MSFLFDMDRERQAEHDLPATTGRYVRIQFVLQRDECGYPPADSEVLWALTEAGLGYKLDNIPFYAQGISFGDIVEADPVPKGPLRFARVVVHSRHSTIRVSLTDECPDKRPLDLRTEELRSELHALGCGTELSHDGFFSVDVPPSAPLESVRDALSRGLAAGLWAYEEPVLWL